MAVEELHFEVSTGLKRVIGRDLITDDEVAIFELVKNSFDAGARNVQLYFSSDEIIIADDGCGMSKTDIQDKWLWVAYSSKNEDSLNDPNIPKSSYRDEIVERKFYAGSKGIGRFSADRLGAQLRLQSRKVIKGKAVNNIWVDWSKFEKRDREDFVKIPVSYDAFDAFDVPNEVRQIDHGTVIEITELHAVWNRGRLLNLKRSLEKLINPFGGQTDDFSLSLVAPDEKAQDAVEVNKANKEPLFVDGEECFPHHLIVNGEIRNFVFDILEEKTTFIDVSISSDGKKIETFLKDRGEEIFRIRQINEYEHLQNSDFKCRLFYLNRAAKLTFHHRMGVRSKDFGSVFLFRNGIRVFPVGEPKDDTWGMDYRKQQGQRRYLGTRDVIGRVDVAGSERDFKEASSRNQGLVETSSYAQLRDCFDEKCRRILERYVVDVSWVDPGEQDTSDLSRLLSDQGRSRVTGIVAKLAKSKDIELVSFSPKLISIFDEKSSEYQNSLEHLVFLAQKANNKELLEQIQKSERRFQEMKRAEKEAVQNAEKERKARETAEKEAREKTQELRKKEQTLKATETKLKTVETSLEREKKRSLFLTSVATPNVDVITNLHHQITIYGMNAHHTIANFIDDLQQGEDFEKDEIISLLSNISFLNQKILATSKFATKANFMLDTESITEDLSAYISQYLQEIVPVYEIGIRIECKTDNKEIIKTFKPIEVAIVVDNLVNNAIKAHAPTIKFALSYNEGTKELQVLVTDDGDGLNDSISKIDQIFEKGVTTTDGSGLGLYHVRQILGDIGGSITAIPNDDRGLTFEVRISK